MKTVTSAEMQAIDQKAIQEYGIPSILLMENAGRGIAGLISLEAIQQKREMANVLFFCGKGNNGGDGLVAARHLKNNGFKINILLFCDPKSLKNDPAVNYKIAEKMKIPIEVIDSAFDENKYQPLLKEADFIVDALFGIGLQRDVDEPYLSAIVAMNESGKKIVSVDVPSGLNADTGEVMGMAVNARWTATLGLPKAGFFMRQGSMHIGELNVIDIGLPRDSYDSNV